MRSCYFSLIEIVLVAFIVLAEMGICGIQRKLGFLQCPSRKICLSDAYWGAGKFGERADHWKV